jgi:hypothetical protein
VNGTDAIKFCVGSREKGIFSYVWRLWWGGTSFYIKPTYSPIAQHKVSLHGPDAKHPKSPWLRFDVDRTAPEDPDTVAITSGLPLEFAGHAVTNRATHVARLRFPWELFISGRPSGPFPEEPKKNVFAAIAPAPAPLYATDLDVYISQGRAFWPAETRARRDNAVLGPLVNSAGQYLTAVSVRRSLLKTATPARALAGEPDEDSDRVRGVGASVDADGVLWICEQWMSKAALLAAKDGTDGVEANPTGAAPPT